MDAPGVPYCHSLWPLGLRNEFCHSWTQALWAVLCRASMLLRRCRQLPLSSVMDVINPNMVMRRPSSSSRLSRWLCADPSATDHCFCSLLPPWVSADSRLTVASLSTSRFHFPHFDLPAVDCSMLFASFVCRVHPSPLTLLAPFSSCAFCHFS